MALLYEANPDLTTHQAREIIRKTASPMLERFTPAERGRGFISAEKAVNKALELKQNHEN